MKPFSRLLSHALAVFFEWPCQSERAAETKVKNQLQEIPKKGPCHIPLQDLEIEWVGVFQTTGEPPNRVGV